MEKSNVDEKFNYAGFWLRLVAYIIDIIFLTIIIFITVFIIVMIWFIMYEIEPTEETGEIGGLIVSWVAGWLYFAIMESSNFQATFGKKIIGLRVVDLDGRKIGFGKASGRYFAKYLSAIILCLGYLMVIWTKKKQSLHDKISDCLVVRTNSPALLENVSISRESKIGQSNDTNLDENAFEAEALRKFKAGEINEETLMHLIKKNSR